MRTPSWWCTCVLTMTAFSLLTACGGEKSPAGTNEGGDSGSDASVDGANTVRDGEAADGLQSVFEAGTCGGPGQRCCLGFACSGGGCCVNNACVASGTTCPSDLGLCSNGSCGSCGGVGQPCCNEASTASCGSTGSGCGGCTAPNATCPGSQLGQTCVACGGDGQPCCNQIACAGAGLLCLTAGTSMCTSQCGQIGQSCCQDDAEDTGALACADGAVCLEQSPDHISTLGGTICVDGASCGYKGGSCTTCGLWGMPCCAGDLCVPNQGQCLPVNGMMQCSEPPGPVVGP